MIRSTWSLLVRVLLIGLLIAGTVAIKRSRYSFLLTGVSGWVRTASSRFGSPVV